MNEYRTYQRLTSDPVMSAAYSRIADLHDEADRRRRRSAAQGSGRATHSLRTRVARLLYRCAGWVEPRPMGQQAMATTCSPASGP
ncbi:hypothetical protein [Williamsia sterculiae]|uniref:Uncharacterized protein n=1 Tax=Williamsia sterculiae TaxID=1344003 RepID=A0A1N7FHB2_9NOCA|nr:hypothetical protein [Williamsia sterculiae]SIR99729.1 hypothetical protein SAMN05445060_2071 [Williamsia sterculiae]